MTDWHAEMLRDIDQVPDHLREGIIGHVLQGRPTGDFLTACLSNDLLDASCRADPVSLHNLPSVMRFLYNNCPGQCWGSPEKVAAWRAQGGLQ